MSDDTLKSKKIFMCKGFKCNIEVSFQCWDRIQPYRQDFQAR